MLEHCGITFSWGTEFGKGGPILAAKIGPGGQFLAADRFFRYNPNGTTLNIAAYLITRNEEVWSSARAYA